MSIFEKYGVFKIFSGMAKSLDPDQTAPQGAVQCGFALFEYAIWSEILVYKMLERLSYVTLNT